MPAKESLPRAFDHDAETDKFLIAVQKKASKNFSRSKQASLENAMRLAYWLYVFGKEDEALEVCRFLGEYEFAGNFNLWSWIEFTLALQSRIMRLRGESTEAAQCVARIRSAGFIASRLTGNLLDDKLERIRRATNEGNKTTEREWSLVALLELCVLIELGGSSVWTVEKLETEFQAIQSRLRVLLKIETG